MSAGNQGFFAVITERLLMKIYWPQLEIEDEEEEEDYDMMAPNQIAQMDTNTMIVTT